MMLARCNWEWKIQMTLHVMLVYMPRYELFRSMDTWSILENTLFEVLIMRSVYRDQQLDITKVI